MLFFSHEYFQQRRAAKREALIQDLVNCALMGIKVHYASDDPEDQKLVMEEVERRLADIRRSQ